ncbi:manganese efflux pump MntP family protein [Desulfovibrio sp. OttesenSCG-928-F07]|nr:manganese efflux pump MntP family protein [Desulfovibrio sp. OttesenSCG-928-F07]
MGNLEVFAIAIALAMDAFAVAIATGLRLRCSLTQTVRMAGAFGFFQFAMPVLGWFLGLSVRSYIDAADHWVAFILLTFVGGKMLYESFKGEDNEDCPDPTKGLTLLILAVATSIDALAVGISISILGADIWLPAAIIGVVCFVITAIGMHIGRMVVSENSTLAKKANIAGGFVLIGIGLKILIEHNVF